MKSFWPLVVVLFLVASCGKEPLDSTPATVVKVVQNSWLTDVDVNNQGVLLACGGLPREHGKLLRSTDGGNTWSVMVSHPSKCFYFVKFINNTTAFAGGDTLELWKTTDSGLHWSYVWLADNVPMHVFDRPAFRHLAVDSCNLVLVGGDNGKKGVCYRSTDCGQSWNFTQMPHQLSGASFAQSGDVLVCGWGYVGSSDGLTQPPVQTSMRGDFFTSVVYSSNSQALMAGYSGVIYQSNDNGLSWTEAYSNSGCSFNKIAVEGGVVVAASDGGRLAVHNPVNGWKLFQLPVSSRVLGLKLPGTGSLYAVTSNGEFLVVDTSSW